MDADEDRHSETQSFRQRVREVAAAYPEATAIALYALIAVLATVAAYLAIFIQFAPYDDEGTLLVTLKAFVHGQTLYRDIYSSYGPFYYELFGGLFSLSGRAVTTDASRSIVIVVWVGASLIFGLAVQRLTRNLLLGASGMIVAFGALSALVSEPMHPQGLCILLISALVLVAVSGPGRIAGRIVLSGGAFGALLAALALTKVNLGIFAIAAVVLAAVLTVEPLHRRRWLRIAVILAFLAMPFLVMSKDLHEAWVRDLILIETLGATAIMIAVWPSRPRHGEDDPTVLRWLLAAAAGLACAFVAIVGIILITGPSPADVYSGIVGDAIRVRSVLLGPFPSAFASVDWAVAAVAGAVLVGKWSSVRDGAPTIWPGLLRGAAGLAIWFTVAHLAPLSINPSAGNPDVLPLTLAWVAAIPPAGVRESGYRRFLRAFLPALAVAETLQVYPVAGTQMSIAAATYVPIGALCLADSLTCLRAWSAGRGTAALEHFGAVVAVVTVALAGVFALDLIARPAASNAVLYHQQQELPLPGANLMHLPASSVETYVGLVDLLHRYRCTTFVGYPNVNSLYLWSGIEAPKPTIPNAWMRAFDKEEQQQVVDELRASPRPCVLHNNSLAEGYLGGSPPPELPLVHYVLHGFLPVQQIGEFQFLLPRDRVAH